MFSTIASPGGLAIVAGRIGIVVAEDLGADRVETLWRVMNAAGRADGVMLEDVLTELAWHGLANIPDFALAEIGEGGRVTVAVRGDAIAVSDGSRPSRILGSDVDTWVEVALDDVESLRLVLGEDPSEAAADAGDTGMFGTSRQPLQAGMAWARELAWGVPAWFEEATPTDSIELPRAADEQPDEPSEAPEELTMMSKRVRRAGHESIEGHTVLRTPKRVPSWVLRFDSGQVIGIGSRVVLGRRPAPTEGAAAGVEQLEQLLSLRREVSANHALLIPEDEGVRLVDLDSTNGTIVRPTDGSSVLLTDGGQHLLRAGERVNFGDGNVAVCERAPLHNS